MDNILKIIYLSLGSLIILFLLTKLMGNREMSQLTMFDYIVSITIGSIAADISLDLEKNLIAGLISLFIFCFAAYLISIITSKSIKARRFFTGVPTVLVENGKIIESGLRKTKIDTNELLAEARIAGYFDLSEIDYAIMEINGSISFMPKEKEKPATKKDMKIKSDKSGLIANVIIDGNYMENNMKAINKDKKWLDHEMKIQGYENYDDILLATVDSNDKLTVYKKNVKPDKNTVLE